jgi:hypothetical protein
MTRLQLFDSVKLRESVTLAEGEVAPAGTRGAVVELLADGEAYMVELFGDWVKIDSKGNWVPVSAGDPDAFTETLERRRMLNGRLLLNCYYASWPNRPFSKDCRRQPFGSQ